MNNSNMFGSAFQNAGRSMELYNHFIDKEVEITLKDEQIIKGTLNSFSENYVFVSGKTS